MNKELRTSNEKCAAQSERLAIMGERLRVAESALAVSALGEQQSSARMQNASRNSAEADKSATSSELVFMKKNIEAQYKNKLDGMETQLEHSRNECETLRKQMQLLFERMEPLEAPQTKLRLSKAEDALRITQAAETPANTLHTGSAVAMVAEGRSNRPMDELRRATKKVAGLEAENQALRNSLKSAAAFSPIRNVTDSEPDDDLEGSPQAGELVV